MITQRYIIASMKHTINPKIEVVPLMVRIRPINKEILRLASVEQRKSMAAIVDDLIVDGLSKDHGEPDSRIDNFLQGFKGSRL